MTKWPDLNYVMESPHGRLQGYSLSSFILILFTIYFNVFLISNRKS